MEGRKEYRGDVASPISGQTLEHKSKNLVQGSEASSREVRKGGKKEEKKERRKERKTIQRREGGRSKKAKRTKDKYGKNEREMKRKK